MRAFDTATIKSGISEEALIKRAGVALYEEFSRSFPDKSGRVILLIGPGNNGADVAEMGRHLQEAGYKVSAFKENAFGGNEESALKESLKDAHFIIDGLLGTGSSGAPRGRIRRIIEIVNNTKTPAIIVAIDIPSGVNPDTGEAELSICAATTFTIQCMKRGMTQFPGRNRCGEIKVVDIGIHTTDTEYSILTDETVPHLPEREAQAHKGNFGYVLVVGGSPNMPGAPILAAEAALRSGAGLVRLASGGAIESGSMPELMYLNSGGRTHSTKTLKEIFGFIESQRPTLVLGPGLGQEKNLRSFVRKIIGLAVDLRLRCVLDADALNLTAHESDIKLTNDFVVTPHPGEAALILGVDVNNIQLDRFKAIDLLAKHFGEAVIVLKGAGTIIRSLHKGFVNLNGNPYLATAGSGDVLAGLIAGLLAQGLDAEQSAKLGVYLHGLAADTVVSKRFGPLIASDLISELPSLVGRFTK